MEFLEHIDRSLLLLINGFHSPFFDFLWSEISKTRTGILIYALIIYYLFRHNSFLRGLYLFIALIVCIALADIISVHAFKNVFERYRPSHNLEIQDMLHFVHGYRGGLYGFVSSHAANLFAFATFVSRIIPNKPLVIASFTWACLGSYSRMYLGVHYPSDILGGALLGIAISLVIYAIFSKSDIGNVSMQKM